MSKLLSQLLFELLHRFSAHIKVGQDLGIDQALFLRHLLTAAWLAVAVAGLAGFALLLWLLNSGFWRRFAQRRVILSRMVLLVFLVLLEIPMTLVATGGFLFLPYRIGYETPNVTAVSVKRGLLDFMLSEDYTNSVPYDKIQLLRCAQAVGDDEGKSYAAGQTSQAPKPVEGLTRDLVLAKIQMKKTGLDACQSVDRTEPVTIDAVRLKAGLDALAAKHNLGPSWFSLDYQGRTVADFGLQGAAADTPAPIGGLSKSITGIAIALLIQDHRLSLDAKVGDLLAKAYADHNRVMDENLKAVTVEQLLTHTAGLPTSKNTDPVNGIVTNKILRRLGPNPTAFDFFAASDADHASGKHDSLYSNISFMLLGLIVETVSGENYEQFCRQRILEPLGITKASLLDGKYSAVGPSLGWVISRRDLITVWRKVFDRQNPTILSQATLDQTLFAPLGPPLGRRNVYNVMGSSVLWQPGHSLYMLYQDGEVSEAFSDKPTTYYSYIEDINSEWIWMFATSQKLSSEEASALNKDVRALVEN